MFHPDYQAPTLVLIDSQVSKLIIQGKLVRRGKHTFDFTDKSHFNHQNHFEKVAYLYMTGSTDCTVMTKKCSSETAETRYSLSHETNLPSTLQKKIYRYFKRKPLRNMRHIHPPSKMLSTSNTGPLKVAQGCEGCSKASESKLAVPVSWAAHTAMPIAESGGSL